MINSFIVNFRQLNSAVSEVQDEFYRLGLWNEGSRLPLTTVYWCQLPQLAMHDALGFFIHKGTYVFGHPVIDSLAGYEVGNIYIPQWVLAHGFWKNRGSLRDVVRHEYAHAVEYHYPMLTTRSQRFKTAFSGDYPEEYQKSKPLHVSDYAATAQTEDFAETFMVYVRHSAKLPSHLNTPHIKRKWKFISELCKAINSGITKW